MKMLLPILLLHSLLFSGVVYEPDVILNVIEWARSKSKNGSLVHTIVDEIYGLSVHEKTNSHKFHSVLKILKNDLKNDVHFLWGLRYVLLLLPLQ